MFVSGINEFNDHVYGLHTKKSKLDAFKAQLNLLKSLGYGYLRGNIV